MGQGNGTARRGWIVRSGRDYLCPGEGDVSFTPSLAEAGVFDTEAEAIETAREHCDPGFEMLPDPRRPVAPASDGGVRSNGPSDAQDAARARAPLTYDDLTEAELDMLQAANLRYLMALGLRGPLDVQGQVDRATYGHLLTLSPSGEGRVDDEQALAFTMAVTRLSRAVCLAYCGAD